MKYLFLAVALALICPLKSNASPATTPATRPAVVADPSTPRGALKACDLALPAGGLKAAGAIYHAEDADQRKAVAAMAQCDLSATKLQKQIREKFGDAAAQEAVRAMRQFSAVDIDGATEEIDGDKATVNFSEDRDSVEMIKVEGKWMISVADMLKDDVKVDDLVDTNETVARELDKIAREIEAGEYANTYLLDRAIRQTLFRLLGDED